MDDLTVQTIETPSLGDRSYLVHDGEVAAVIDPQRDVDRVLALLDRHGLRLSHVLETHVHNDYLTGGPALADRCRAAYVVHGKDPVEVPRTPVADGDVVEVGDRIRLRAIATPGHTFHHLSYALLDGATAAGVFTGGSLLYGATGRPDLLGEAHTDRLAHLQHASARRLAAELPDEAEIYPTHGFGSFCSPGAGGGGESSTIGRERATNPVLLEEAEAWVRGLLRGLDVWPSYYTHMAPRNLAGPGEPDLSPVSGADPAELRRRIDAGEWVVDLRHRVAFAAGHAPGTLNVGLDGSFATYVGWLIDWGTPITLLGSSPEQVAEAQRELVRIGIDRPAAAAHGAPEEWTGRPLADFPVASFADLAQARRDRPVTIVDVRRRAEHDERHIDGALNLPIHELRHRLEEVPRTELWVHCEAGYRASIGASILAAAGHRVVVVDDSFGSVDDAGLPTSP